MRALLMRTSIALLFPCMVFADPPAGYYDAVDLSSPAAMRSTLHDVIDDHQRFPYTAGGTDTWDILEQADEDPQDSANILDVYMNASYEKQGGGNVYYNREHTWPKSYGFPDDGWGNYPFTDCHQLMLSDVGYNGARGNYPFGTCDALCAEYATEGGTLGVYPGTSNWTDGSSVWEVWSERKGDVARTQIYMDVRYEGGVHGGTGYAEPDLILTDDVGLIQTTGSNASVAYMGRLSVLLQWHRDDPVTDEERLRNDIVASYQGNRNPFVDHPEWADCIFEGVCGLIFADGFESEGLSSWSFAVE